MQGNDRDLLIIIATYNERENLPILVEQLMNLEVPADLAIIDDNSPDGTGQLAEELAGKYEGRIYPRHRSAKLGLASALKEGFRFGLDEGYDVIMTMDADLSHNPARVPELYAAVQDADLAIGSRYIPGGGTENWPWYRRWLSRGGSILARLMAGLKTHDCTGGFRAYRSCIITQAGLLDSSTEGYAFQVEALYRCQRAGAKIAEVPITFTDRQRGASKISKRIIFEAAWVLCRLAWDRLTTRRRPRSGTSD